MAVVAIHWNDTQVSDSSRIEMKIIRSSEGGTVPSVAIETESRRHVKKSKDYKKKFEAATCKLEEKHVTKEEDLPMWLRERLEGGKFKETLMNNRNDITPTVV